MPQSPDHLEPYLTGGFITTLGIVLGAIAKLCFNWAKATLKIKRPGTPISQLTDSSSAVDTVTKALNAVAQESNRKDLRIASLEKRIDQLVAELEQERDKNG